VGLVALAAATIDKLEAVTGITLLSIILKL
jgi:hypothetical protein